MIRQPISRWLYVTLGVCSFLTLGVIYTMVFTMVHEKQPGNKTVPSWSQLYNEGLVGAFSPRHTTQSFSDWDEDKQEIVWTTIEHTRPPLIWEDGQITLFRLGMALFLTTLIAVPLGLLMGCYQAAEAFFLPPLSFLAKIPATAMLAVFLALLNTNLQIYLGTIVFGLVPILAQTVFHAARDDVPEELLYKARTLGASQFSCVWDVILRFILPKVMESVRLQIGPAIIYLIAGELMLGETGFGCRMHLLQRSLDMSIIYTYLITLGLFGLFIDRALMWLQTKICPWYSSH